MAIMNTWKILPPIFTDPTIEAAPLNSSQQILECLQIMRINSTKIVIEPPPEEPQPDEENPARIIPAAEVQQWRQWSQIAIPFIATLLRSQGRFSLPHHKKSRWLNIPDMFKSPKKEKELDQTEIQKALSSKKKDGPLDGLFCEITGNWVADTQGIHKICSRKITQMYDKHWFARLSQSILWEEKEDNSMIRAKLFEKKTFTKNLASSMSALDALVALLGKLTSESTHQKSTHTKGNQTPANSRQSTPTSY